MGVRINSEEEMERQQEIQAERQLIALVNQYKLPLDIKKLFNMDIMDDIKQANEYGDYGMDTEESYRIRCESLAEMFQY